MTVPRQDHSAGPPGARRVVVGYDGSDDAEQAVLVAAGRARRYGLLLELVGAVDRWRSSLWHGEDAEHEAEVSAHERLERLAVLLQGDDPALAVSLHVGMGPPVPLLLSRAQGAESLVVGARGHGGFPGLHLGHVGSQLCWHAPCPVLVVRGSTGSGVVVGVEDSSSSDAALEFAFAEAAAQREPLLAVQAWQPAWVDLRAHAGGPSTPPSYPAQVDELRAQRQERLDERLQALRATHPDVQAQGVLRPLHPVAALLETAHGSRMVVVGSHGLGGVAGVLLGSVSRGVVERADTTVAVVRS